MMKIWQVFIYEFWRNIRRKGFLFATLGLPLLGFISLFGNHIYQTQSNPDDANPLAALDFDAIETAGYVDESGIFTAVPESLEGILIAFPDVDAARDALNSEEVDVFYIIAEDYLETGDVVLHIPQLQMTIVNSGPIEQLLYSTFAGDLDDTIIRRLRNPMIVQEFDLTETEQNGSSQTTEGYEFAIVYASTMLFFFALILTNTYLMQSVIQERENKLLEMLLATVRPNQLLTGKILALGSLGLVQIAVWAAGMGGMVVMAKQFSTYDTALTLLGLSMRWDVVPLLLIYFLLMYMTFACVFASIGALSNSAQEGSQYIGLIIIPTILPFYAFPLIQAEPGGLLAVSLSMIPITSAVTMQMRVVFGSVPLWQMMMSISFMALTMVGALWLAGRLFRVQTLLSGQGFKLSQLPRLLVDSEH